MILFHVKDVTHTVYVQTWKTSLNPNHEILQIQVFVFTSFPGSRDRWEGSSKFLNLSRNCPSQPTQFLFSGVGNPTSWNASTQSAAKVVICVSEKSRKACVAKNLFPNCAFDDRHVCGTNRFRTPDLVCSTIRSKKDFSHRPNCFHMSVAVSAVRCCLSFLH